MTADNLIANIGADLIAKFKHARAMCDGKLIGPTGHSLIDGVWSVLWLTDHGCWTVTSVQVNLDDGRVVVFSLAQDRRVTPGDTLQVDLKTVGLTVP